ncbi:MAG: alpha-2-macroglobulin [Planctomycetes bacterium]|nr:alpha-2-macroglobulin [Planctomycetota bacterium]
MNRSKIFLLTALTLGVVAAGSFTWLSAAMQAPDRQQLHQEFRNGNYRDAYEGLRKILLDPETDPRHIAEDLNLAVQALNQLGRTDEIDELLEGAIDAHDNQWRALQAAAQQYLSIVHQGFMIAGEFHRGHHRGGGKVVNSVERDRVRALQLLEQASPLAMKDDLKNDVAQFYFTLAGALLNNRGHAEAWRLQYLTDIGELPDYDEGWHHYREYQGVPVDAEGNPIFHDVPASWDAAETDGERWRWALEQVVEMAPARREEVLTHRANFLHNQFGVQTMAHGRWTPFFGAPEDDDEQDESGTYVLHTLEENETIARTAIGIRRFKLPDEHNFIKLYQQVADEAKPPQSGQEQSAINVLAQIFENRRQYPKAADYWRESLKRFPPPPQPEYRKQRLAQLVDNWGRFEPVMTQPADNGAALEYRFRNGEKVAFTAHAIRVEQLLDDIKTYLRRDPGRLDWQKVNLGDIGYRLVQQNEQQYVGERVARWSLELEPRPNHWDKRITIDTPLQKPGAYLVTAAMEDGNISKVVVWVSDTAIVKQALSGKNLYYVADAVTGKPVPGVNLEFFGYQQKHLANNVFRIYTSNFAERTGPDGMAAPDPRDLRNDYQWLVTARGPGDRFAYLGFSGAWTGQYYDAEYNAIKTYIITDRPVYRPDQDVKFKAWVRHAQYDNENLSDFAGRSFVVEIYDPRGEKVYDQPHQADEYGGLDGVFEVGGEATLGVYQLVVKEGNDHRGQNQFRVEEYKKPEFEVQIDAPSEPVMLGEKITATIKADYYFGAPVTNATVKYKITRSEHDETWYPYAPWDWFYGEGYWWFAYDYAWYPGWGKWHGCVRPSPWWWRGGPRNPPELVAEQEVEIGPDGTVQVEIDTAVAKELHGDQDHRYTISAEVRDESRRIIHGEGTVLVARKPFKVFSWVEQGYYQTGDVVNAHFRAQTLDRKPVQGEGELTLLKITYNDEAEPVETPVEKWDLDTSDQGEAQQKFEAAQPGQYRLSYKVTDKAGHVIEGGYIFTVIGRGFDGEEFRFNELELIPEKREYQPGETIRLQINTNRAGATVLLFVRPANGVYLEPRVIRMTGKSTVEEIGVVKKDMPNFFVEALTVYNANVYTQVKEIVVPPENRVLNLAVDPSAKTYKPGEKATVKIKLTDFDGEPFHGQTTVAIYDKSVEYISGGSNTTDIREFYWKWRRQHNPQHEHSLSHYGANQTLPGALPMQDIGVFGATLPDDLAAFSDFDTGEKAAAKRLRGPDVRMFQARGGAFGGGGFAPGAPMAAAAEGQVASESFFAGDDRQQATPPPADAAKGALGPAGGEGGQLVEASVRTQFADTALWKAALETNKEGEAEVSLTMPENLTTWKVRVWGMGAGTRVGSGEAEMITRKNLILRLQAPRFLVQKDEVVLSANVHNYLDEAKDVHVSLELPGDELEPTDELERVINVEAGGEQRVDWRVKVLREGTAVVRMKALTDEESDATETKVPVFVHGMLKMESWAGTMKPEKESSSFTVTVPAERRPEQSELVVRYSPTLAGAMVDALPYLVDYPYGCTEQTLNRFLPTVITQNVLLEMDLNLAEIAEKRTNLNAQELGDPQDRAEQWQRFGRNPVFDEAEVQRMVKEGLKLLANMQNEDGGWGWFSGYRESSWPHTTAVVVHGLQIAQENDVPLVPGMLERGVEWLKRYQEQEVRKLQEFDAHKTGKQHADNLDALVYMVLVDAGAENRQMRDYLYRDRTKISVYAKGMFGLALHKVGDEEKLVMIVRNIDQYLVQDEENETAYLKLPQSDYWWYWYGSEIEANAYYLKLLSRVEPQGEKAPRLVKYLLNNRKHATYWRSTRDTAYCVEAFADYLRATGELSPDMTVEIWIDDQKRGEARITPDNLFTFDAAFALRGEEVTTGEHQIEIRRRGQGPVYWNAYLTNFTLEDHITAAGLEVKVHRDVYKLVPRDKTIKAEGARGQAADQRVEAYERVKLDNLATLQSGDLVEVELVIESKNDYEYLIFEDKKAAGFEPVEVQSGYTQNGLGAYMELRDESVTFFVRRLARGRHSIAYRLHAETPGKFSALPAVAQAMYAPELRGNSEEIKLKVED